MRAPPEVCGPRARRSLDGCRSTGEERPRGPGAGLYPVVLPYRLGTLAAFTHAGFNSPALGDDGMTLMLTSGKNTPFGDGVRPDTGLFLDDFPYLGVPSSSEHTSS